MYASAKFKGRAKTNIQTLLKQTRALFCKMKLRNLQQRKGKNGQNNAGPHHGPISRPSCRLESSCAAVVHRVAFSSLVRL